MIYNEENVKYCLLTWDKFEDEHINSYGNNDFCLSGLYNWSKVFNGKRTFPRTCKDFDKYNLIHINMTPKNLPLISKILPKIDRNKTKILLNVDFAIELWGTNFSNPHLFLQEIDKADFIFGVEENMCELLSSTLKRKVPCIPHPSPIKKIKEHITNERDKRILTIAHRYDNNFLLPWYAINNMKDESFVTSIIGAYTAIDKAVHLYDEVIEYKDFSTLIPFMAKHYLAIESYMIHSYGRTSIECAALGVPCIGANTVSSIRRCFPELTHEINDVNKIEKLMKILINEPQLYGDIAKHAMDESEYYSFDNCKKMMLNFINGKI